MGVKFLFSKVNTSVAGDGDYCKPLNRRGENLPAKTGSTRQRFADQWIFSFPYITAVGGTKSSKVQSSTSQVPRSDTIQTTLLVWRPCGLHGSASMAA